MKQGEIWRYSDGEKDLYQVCTMGMADCMGHVLVNLSTGSVVDFEWKAEDLMSKDPGFIKVGDSLASIKPELDIQKVELFAKHFKDLDLDTGEVAVAKEFIKAFPSRKKQANEYAVRIIEEIVLPSAKKIVKDNDES